VSRRRLRLAVAVALLAITAGCLGGGPVSEQELDEEPPLGGYAWDAGVDVHIAITEGARFQAVYNASAFEQGSVELYRNDGVGGRNPIPVSAVRYRYENGTQLNGSEFRARGGEVSRSREVVNVTLPPDAAGGQLAFTSQSTPKRFTLPVFVEGSYEVVLPPDRDISVPIIGSTSPGASEVATDEQNRVHIRWAEVTSRNIVVQFYLQRDLYIFGGLLAVLFVIGGLGLFRYQRQIKVLQEEREELGLDVETDDDEFDQGPPPGMR